DVFRDEGVAGRGGVNSIGLVELRMAAHALKQEGNEREMIFFRQLGKEGAEGPGVIRAEIGRNLHSGENDAGGGIFAAHPVDDGLQICPRVGGGNAAQTVVAAELEDKKIDRLAQDPVDAAPSAGGGF